VRGHLVQVVTDTRLCDGADIALLRLEHIGVVGWEDGGRGADDWAERIVHLFGRGLVDGRFEGGALCGGGGGGRDRWVLAQVVVVISSCTNDWALDVWSACNVERRLKTATYSLSVDGHVHARVVWWENIVGGSDDWARHDEVVYVKLYKSVVMFLDRGNEGEGQIAVYIAAQQPAS
jgi:hypothetical protein